MIALNHEQKLPLKYHISRENKSPCHGLPCASGSTDAAAVGVVGPCAAVAAAGGPAVDVDRAHVHEVEDVVVGLVQRKVGVAVKLQGAAEPVDGTETRG